MPSIRRAYVLFTCALSLQAATWAAIFLLRHLLQRGAWLSTSDLAFQIAVLIVLVPIFLLHWRWAERLAASPAERAADARRLYLQAMGFFFLLGILTQAHGLLRALLLLAEPTLSGLPEALTPGGPPAGQRALDALVAILVLALVWRWNRRVLTGDRAAVGEPGRGPAFRRLRTLGLAAIGLVLGANGLIGIVHAILAALGGRSDGILSPGSAGLHALAASSLVGALAWALAWREAQAGFESGRADEEASSLRKLYLYGAVLVTALACVANLAFILAGFFRVGLGLPMEGDLRLPLSVIGVAGLIWAYHHRVLEADARAAPEAPRQAGIRRLYLYLVAAIGLAAFGAGLAGLVSVLIRLAGATPISDAQREILAWSAAGILAGLPVWALPWRRAQAEALGAGEAGEAARAALPRKAYLYLYLLITTVALVTSAVYVIYRLVSFALGEPDPENDLGLDLAQALALAGIAAGGWGFHLRALRADGDLDEAASQSRLSELETLILDAGDGQLGHALLHALTHELAGLPVAAIGLTPGARDRLGDSGEDDAGPAEAIPTAAALAAIHEADLLILPWNALEAGGDTPELARALAHAKGRRLLLPTRDEGVEWAGVDRWSDEDLVEQAVAAVARMAAGAEVEPQRPLGAGTMVLLAVGGLILTAAIGIPLAAFLDQLF